MNFGDEDHGGSAPCFGQLIVGREAIDPETARDVARFRKAERERLLACRKIPLEDRKTATDTLINVLQRIVKPETGMRIAVYWPIRGEPDLRLWRKSAHAAGAQVLLPVVIEKNQPLEFHEWSPDCRMTRGVWNILVPEAGSPEVPDVVVAPLVGADRVLYRLGNGGGYYDRTIASMQGRPRLIGVGFSGCMIDTIYPMPWDVPMDEVVLSDGTHLSCGE